MGPGVNYADNCQTFMFKPNEAIETLVLYTQSIDGILGLAFQTNLKQYAAVGQIDTVDSRTFKFSDTERFLGFDAIMIAVVTLNTNSNSDPEGKECSQPVWIEEPTTE